MSDAGGMTKAEMLAAAKKKLKDYESRRQNSPTSSVISSEPTGVNGGRSSVVSDESAGIQNHSTPSPFQNSQAAQSNGNEWFQAYSKLKSQHDELCTHYAQLHAAYSQVNANGVHVDAENQIVQLQAALSTMVEEKLACQSELRKTKEELEKLKTEKETIASKPPLNHDIGSENSVEIRNLTGKIQEKDSLLLARQHELEKLRRELSVFQADFVNVQHERSEAQARVKSLVRENTGLEKIVDDLKKEIQMKDLHLKQMGAHKSGNLDHIDSKDGAEKLEETKREVENLKSEKSRLLGEAATLKSHFMEREHALQQKIQELGLELEQVHSHRFTADDRVHQLENQLSLSQLEIERLKNLQIVDNGIPQQMENIQTEEVILKRIREAVHCEKVQFQKTMEDEQRRVEGEIMEKDRIIFEREQSLAEVEMKLRLLEERMLETTANGADLLSLSEQLQNEKATVSRAVAQNRELKAQLIETEDRLIGITEEKMQLELDKQSAEHQVKELTKQLNLETAGLVTNISEVIASQPHLESNIPEELEKLKEENLEMRRDLEAATVELTQVRAELRRSNTQNEQMDEIMRQNAEDENQNSIHVELTQAVGRVNELAAENEQYREVVNDLSRQLNEERERTAEAERRVAQKNNKVENEITPKESEELWAKKELEKRFAKAMMQNAELTETIDRLEHINQQLELENDTIADHVILYQHQRKMVRERLRVKDEQLKAMEEERARTVARCQELQNVLMTVLNKGGVLKEYETTSLSKKIARKVSRSYSHSTVDETSGDEDVIVDGKDEIVPERMGNSPQIHGESSSKVTSSSSPKPPESSISPRVGSPVSRPLTPINEGKLEQDASVRRILEIISDISRPQAIVTGQLHCTQCIGELKEI